MNTLRYSLPLPPAIAGDKGCLSPEGKEAARALYGARPLAFSIAMLSAWAMIAAAIFLAEHSGHLWAKIIAIIFIGTRMNILALLVHEQAHSLGYKFKYGDVLVNLLVAYPLLVLTVDGYAKVHLSHHRFYFTDRDPDLRRKSGEEWTFPLRPGKLWKLFLSDLAGLTIIKLIRGKKFETEEFPRRVVTPAWVRPLYLICLISLIVWLGGGQMFLIYWLLPLVTLLPVIVRLGAISEHVYIPNAGLVETSPLIIPRWWERIILPNLNFTYHIYHHWHPGVAFSNLPALHGVYVSEGLVNQENLFHGYYAYLKHIQRRD